MVKANVFKPGLVYDTLKEEIIYLKLKPGELVSETETATRFNVSRTSIRSAFKKLETEGLIQIVPKKGTFVTLISMDAINDTLFMRETLEVACIKELIDQPTIPVYKINSILIKQQQVLEDEDTDIEETAREFFKLDNDFHKVLFELAGKERIWDLLSKIDYQYTRFRMFLNVTDIVYLKELYQTHLSIFEMIVHGNKEEIDKAYHEHLYTGIRLSSIKISENPKYFLDL